MYFVPVFFFGWSGEASTPWTRCDVCMPSGEGHRHDSQYGSSRAGLAGFVAASSTGRGRRMSHTIRQENFELTTSAASRCWCGVDDHRRALPQGDRGENLTPWTTRPRGKCLSSIASALLRRPMLPGVGSSCPTVRCHRPYLPFKGEHMVWGL